MTAQSSLTTFDGTIDMGFIIDVSGYMNFPSLLYESTQVTGVKDLSHINDRRWYNDQTLGQREWGLDTNHIYYIIADPSGTATVCYLYYYNNNWWLCDASKDRYTGNGRFDPANGHSADNTQYYDLSYYTSTSYVIMEAGDRVTQEDFDDPETSVLLSKHNLQIGDPKTRAFYLEKSLNGTIIKAKEDLLGANAAMTNAEDAVVEAKAYKTSENGPSIPLVDKKYIDNDPDKGEDPKYTRIAYRESPRVNINELSFLGNDTEWSVYLSTSVDPKTELRGLYDNIIVEEVIQLVRRKRALFTFIKNWQALILLSKARTGSWNSRICPSTTNMAMNILTILKRQILPPDMRLPITGRTQAYRMEELSKLSMN